MSDYIWNLIFINDLNNFEILQQVLIQLPQNKQIHWIKCWFLAKKKKLNAANEEWNLTEFQESFVQCMVSK